MDMPQHRFVATAFAVALSLAAWQAAWAQAGSPAPAAEPLRVVSKADVLSAMKKCGGYAVTATSNNVRFQAEVVLRLILQAEREDAERRPLLIGHREWYEAFLARTGLSPSHAPLAVRISHELEQDMLVDYRREHVVDRVLEGPQPKTVANVWIYWPDAPGRPGRHSYDDRHATPRLRVTQERMITYRLVDYGDRLWYADVQGLHGRPTSGGLGALFALIGEATIVESRSTIAPDGTLVVRSHARKWRFDKSETMTVLRSGRVHQGIAPGRPDLRALEARLEEPLAIRFVPLVQPWPATPAPLRAAPAWRGGGRGRRSAGSR